ncbi:MAG: hypothetical protein KC420_14340, partial [Myxococcales bacterium]|nr:hypothetical protein [Myxococcales bacterium]
AIAGGGVLLGGGVVAFFAGSLYFRRSRALCEDAACYLDDTRGLLISVDAAALGMAVGAGLLGHGLAYRARIARNRRDHGLAGGRLQIAPLVSGGFVGLGVGGAL